MQCIVDALSLRYQLTGSIRDRHVDFNRSRSKGEKGFSFKAPLSRGIPADLIGKNLAGYPNKNA